MSKIEWTEKTWNPITGCKKVSPGCKFCYAETMSRRLKAMGLKEYADGFEPRFHEDRIHDPYTWRKPQMVFVCSMSDLFQEDIDWDDRYKIFKTMNDSPRHTYQVLTKRSEALRSVYSLIGLTWSPNIWAGVSVENADYKYRIDDLRECPAKTKFLSLEPLLGPLGTLDLTGIDWVIAGGESGPKARPMQADWVREIRDQCLAAEVPFFFKQWGGKNKKKAGRELDGRKWNEMPERREG